MWGTLVGLTMDGKAVAGLMAQPFTGEIYMSLPGEASYSRLRQGADADLAADHRNSRKAKLTATSPTCSRSKGVADAWARMRKAVLTTRYGLGPAMRCWRPGISTSPSRPR